MTAAVSPPAQPAGTSVPALSRRLDDMLAQHALTGVVVVYLLFALLLPLGFVLAKSLQAFSFAPQWVEVRMDRGQGWEPEATLADWVQRSGYVLNDGLRASERSREQLAKIIPKPERKDVQRFQVRDLSESPVLLLDGAELATGSWQDVPREAFGKLQLRPIYHYSLDNFGYYFSTPRLSASIWNSLWTALAVVLLVIPAAFAFAYALTRSHMPFKRSFRLVAMIPVLAPSMLPAIGLVYLFGKQGVLRDLLFGADIYGPLGVIIASAYFTFPHALIILLVALSSADQRLYEAAEVLGAPRRRRFFTVTLPGVRYGLISAAFVVFTLVITDFGVPKVIGGSFNMLALDIYKQVIGQQNFQMGAVVSMVLLLPAILAFVVDRYISRKQTAQLSSRAMPFVVDNNRGRDRWLLVACLVIAVFIVGVIVMCQFAALAKFWPYDLTLGFQHYAFDRMDGGGWAAYLNSLKMALLVATLGAVLIFLGAYLVEKGRSFASLRLLLQLLAMLPMAIPGMVLGLAYIFYFNNPLNPAHFLYGTLAILVISTITHLYTVPHITASTALKQMDNEFEAVSLSLQQPFWRNLLRVSVPVCLPALAEIWLYLFVNAMTTVSAVVFLYSPDTALASVAILNMDDAGDIAPAAAMALMIFYTNAWVRIVHTLLVERAVRGQKWRMR